ncbi:endonuclease/exonuclease/phosphatase family protein [Parapedobacter sp. 10938]|uniref:endonuclease/exonuclease/phosphatase family protein n=1 Tax=Parapedobacter flavus TaxID=3110225 RepID=UPI002DBE5752|nr:endonuclease/exonuclease/phosphatase family protein [Parapedobacter sp. 10938]MEC3878404.1 endonuclease/exonuclease/phosphatase family protein [Parapedobacter sp. 10938]
MSCKLNRKDFIRAASSLAIFPLVSNDRATLPSRPNQRFRSAHRVLTCNIRVDLPADAEKGFGWQDRKGICIKIIAEQQPDVICLQEVLKGQMEDLMAAFPGFAGVGFDGPEMDAHLTGYHGVAKNPILFSKDRYELVGAGTYWLSETPLRGGSISWGSARARHANYVRLKERETNKEFRVINLHLDHKSQEAREEQVKLVLAEAAQYTADFPQLLTGDFNASMANQVYRLVLEQGWRDSYTHIHGDTEPGYTVHLFKGDRYEKKAKGKKIDFIFAKGHVHAVDAEIIRDHVGGQYPSDHYFVSADVKLK